MKTLTLAALLCLSAAPALAQYPIPRDGNRPCPYGYNGSGGYCVPTSDRSRPGVPQIKGQRCPYGTTASGGACLSTR